MSTRRLLFLFIALVIACEEKKEKIDYGPEAKPENIVSKLIDPLKDFNIRDIYPDDFINTSLSLQVSSKPPCVYEDIGLTVLERHEVAAGINIKLVGETALYDLNTPTCEKTSDYKKEYNFGIDNDDIVSSVVNSKPNKINSTFSSLWSWHNSNLTAQAPGCPQDESACKRSYHNLRTSYYEKTPPDNVAQTPNCSGIPNCQMRITKINFDELVWLNSENPDLRKWEYEITPDVPAVTVALLLTHKIYGPTGVYGPGGMLKECVSRLMKSSSGPKVYVKLCTKLDNFQFGDRP